MEQSGAHTQRGLLLLFILHLFPGPQSTLSQVSKITKIVLCDAFEQRWPFAFKKLGIYALKDELATRITIKEIFVHYEKNKRNECTSTFARYAIRGSAIEDHPPKERAVGNVLLGPGRPQSPTPTTLLPTHPWHVEHLAPPVLPLLQPAVSSCN